jgi:hypothetical protein
MALPVLISSLNMMSRLFLVCLLSVFASLVQSQTEALVWYKSYDSEYINSMLNRALEVSQNGKYTLKRSAEIEEGRAFANLVDETGVDIMVAGADAVKEAYLAPIYIPLDKGLLGFRVCLSAPNLLPRLSDIQSLNDLHLLKISVGSGQHWADTPILLQNEIFVVSTPVFSDLFKMASSERFDCLPRGLLELDEDLQRFQPENLIVEPSFAMVYPLGLFVFVNKLKPNLKTDIEAGLNALIESGEFAQVFYEHYADAVEKHGLYNRKIIFLENDAMSPRLIDSLNKHGVISFIK